MGKHIKDGVPYSGTSNNAIKIKYDDTESNLNVGNVQEAIEAVKDEVDVVKDSINTLNSNLKTNLSINMTQYTSFIEMIDATEVGYTSKFFNNNTTTITDWDYSVGYNNVVTEITKIVSQVVHIKIQAIDSAGKVFTRLGYYNGAKLFLNDVT